MEDTQVKTQEDTEALAAWHKAEEAKEPDQSMKDKEIKDANLPTGVGMRYNSLESAGWCIVYHQETGEPSTINKNWLLMQLKKKLPNGKKAFDIYPPKDKDGNVIQPRRGTIKCHLHKDDPNREKYNSAGFAECPKDNIASKHSLIQHMKHRHKVEWESIENDRKEAEKLEDRTFQRNLYEKLSGTIPQGEAFPFVCKECREGFTDSTALAEHEADAHGKAPLYVSNKDKIK